MALGNPKHAKPGGPYKGMTVRLEDELFSVVLVCNGQGQAKRECFGKPNWDYAAISGVWCCIKPLHPKKEN